eukprot:scaffold250367_cov31-Tisochrysis_lutea.AAC.2
MGINGTCWHMPATCYGLVLLASLPAADMSTCGRNSRPLNRWIAVPLIDRGVALQEGSSVSAIGRHKESRARDTDTPMSTPASGPPQTRSQLL